MAISGLVDYTKNKSHKQYASVTSIEISFKTYFAC